MAGCHTTSSGGRKFSCKPLGHYLEYNLNPESISVKRAEEMDEESSDKQEMGVWEIKEQLKEAEKKLKDLNEAAELAFSVIREKENILLGEISALREELKKRGGGG